MSARSSTRLPAANPDWAFFLDVDGTLLEIADQPSAVRVDLELLDLIGKLSRSSGGALALVSGRSISDLEDLLGARRMPLAGQHGLERRDATGRLWIHAAPPAAKCSFKEALAPVLARHPGLLLEDKGLTLALHYRQAPHLAAYAHRLMDRLMRSRRRSAGTAEGQARHRNQAGGHRQGYGGRRIPDRIALPRSQAGIHR